jgi:vacuolar protein sorting-associated protein VTA1
MDLLEKSKQELGPDAGKDRGQAICKAYALNTFAKADEEDRAGIADRATAKIFYSAGTFFDILEQFGEIEIDIQEKKVYAKWKATEILNAIKEGRQPEPGGGFGEAPAPSGIHDQIVQIPNLSTSNIPSSAFAPPSASSSSSPPFNQPIAPQQSQPQQYQQQPTPPFIRTQLPTNSSASSSSFPMQQPLPGVVNVGPPLSNLDPRVKDCIELCHFTIAALKVRYVSYNIVCW